MSLKLIRKHAKEFAAALKRGEFEITDSGLVFPKQKVLAAGEYFTVEDGQDVSLGHNLQPDQALISMLNVYFKGTTQLTAWYLSLFSGAVTPDSTYTAANYPANASEITSNSEGYSNSTRPQWVPGTPASNALDNLTSKAVFNIECTTSITVQGGALHSSNVKGGTSGVLGSVARFNAARTLYDGDPFELGYKVTLTG